MSTLILGLDMGTTSISAVAVDDSGHVVHAVTKSHYASVAGLSSEYAEQDSAKILRTAIEALAELQQNIAGHQVRGLALTGQMHSTVLLNAGCQVLGNVITWQDRRSLAVSSSGTLLSELQQRATENAMLSTGCRMSAGYLGTTLFAMRRLQQLPNDVAHVSFVADWIGSCLTGQEPVTERSHAASSGLFDLMSDAWSEALVHAAEIPAAWLPAVRDSGTIIGTMTPAMANATGLSAGLPVLNAIGDNQASVLSALPDQPGSVLINIGTGGQIVWRVPEFTRQLPMDTRILPGNPKRDGGRSHPQFMIVGAGLCGGDAIAWVNRTVRQWLQVFGVTLSEQAVWERVQSLADQQHNSSELVCEPFFRGTRYEPDRRGILSGIDPDNLTPANLLISVLDGIAQSMHHVWITSATSQKHPLQRVAMSGNAVKRNPLLVESVRRRFGVPVEVAVHSEEAATGAAILAGVSLGIWNSIEDARHAIQNASQQDEHAPGKMADLGL